MQLERLDADAFIRSCQNKSQSRVCLCHHEYILFGFQE